MLNLSNPIALVFCALIIFLGGFYSGYSYRDYKAVEQEQQEQKAIQQKQTEVNQKRQETNDSIKESNNSVVKEREKASEENSTQIIEVVKYVQSPNGAAKCVDDDFVQQYNKSLPN